MKSPILPVSLPPEIRADVVKLSAKKNIAVSEFIRLAVVEKLSAETGKKYILIPWGGRRPGAGRKPAQSAPPRRPVPADGEIKPRSRRAADAGTKKRRSSAA